MPSYVQYKKMLAVLDANDDDITWITVKGNHIPIKKGQEKGEAIKEFFEKKSGKSQESGSGKSVFYKNVSGKQLYNKPDSKEKKGYTMIENELLSEKEMKKYGFDPKSSMFEKRELADNEHRFEMGVRFEDEKATRRDLAMKIAELIDPQKISKKEYANRLLNGVGAVKPYSLSELKNEYERRVKESAGGRVPKQYRRAYGDMMERVHKSANTEVTEEDGKKGAIELAKKLGKPYGEKEISQRIADYGDYRLKAPLVKNDKGKMVEVDTQMKYKKGGKFVDGEYKGGEYTPARYSIQQKIIWDTFKDWESKVPTEGKPKLVILGGRGGSGKSHFTKGENAQYPKDKFVVIDPDAFKESLPEYKNLVDSGDKYKGLNAWEVHEESSDMKKRALEMAKNLGVNTVLDGTLSKYESVKKVVDEFKKAGYDVDGAYMHLPREKSTARGILRGMNGRFVPVGELLKMKSNEDVFEQLMPDFSKWTIYDNDVPFGEKPKLVAKSE